MVLTRGLPTPVCKRIVESICSRCCLSSVLGKHIRAKTMNGANGSSVPSAVRRSRYGISKIPKPLVQKSLSNHFFPFEIGRLEKFIRKYAIGNCAIARDLYLSDINNVCGWLRSSILRDKTVELERSHYARLWGLVTPMKVVGTTITYRP